VPGLRVASFLGFGGARYGQQARKRKRSRDTLPPT
jgi:hypothetical protein